MRRVDWGSSKGSEAEPGCPWGQEALDSSPRMGATSSAPLPQAEACPTATAGCSGSRGLSTPTPTCKAQYLRTLQWPQPPPSKFLDPMPIFPFETPLPLAYSSSGVPPPPTLLLLSCSSATCWAPPALSPIGSPTLPLLPSSAPSLPSSSGGCNIRFTIWGLSCYNNRRRLCCEEQLAPCAASIPAARSAPLPATPQPQPGLFPVCVFANVCPGLLPLGIVTCDCLFMVACVNLADELHIVCVCACVCTGTHTIFAAFLLHRVSSLDRAWEKGHVGWVPVGGVS